ncbi:SMP-30/gluconolactonase/LRE family protein [Bailinhaonella thermotolerans]|uniref:Superoxide dismutase n=1 Tax=Bailinhaonella thermotolerans TaxID=1070861 RepID=A0A3A4BVC4_9ACTN|nr:superoxide dismutase [Bailinhaonella thermotolerans]RJL35538.1 superoxide dismutase [Bailinhaonella thermotolerans]
MKTSPRLSRRAVLAGAAAAVTPFAAAGTARAGSWPDEFPLPDGFRPEGIAIGGPPYAYMGSLENGAVYRADLRTGRGALIHPGAPGTAAAGMKLDHDGLLYVAGGPQGVARVLDTRTGSVIATHRLAPPAGHLINDVVLLRDRAWFTDSRDNVLYGVPRGRPGAVRALRLGGDWQQVPDVVNANGLVAAPGGHALIVVSSQPVGRLYRVDPRTGHATALTLRGTDNVQHGDGLLRVGRTLYVVQNRLNRVAVFDLGPGAATATLRRHITDPRFDVPSTVARHGSRLYLVNARFGTPPTPATPYNAVAVPR